MIFVNHRIIRSLWSHRSHWSLIFNFDLALSFHKPFIINYFWLYIIFLFFIQLFYLSTIIQSVVLTETQLSGNNSKVMIEILITKFIISDMVDTIRSNRKIRIWIIIFLFMSDSMNNKTYSKYITYCLYLNLCSILVSSTDLVSIISNFLISPISLYTP